MTIRSKQIPPGKGNHYLYEQKSKRSQGRVKTQHVRYIGRASGGSVATFDMRAADGSVVPNSSDVKRVPGEFPPALVKRKLVRRHIDGDTIYRVQYGNDGRLYLDVQGRNPSVLSDVLRGGSYGLGLNAPLRPGVSAAQAIEHVKTNDGRFLGQIIEQD